MTVYYKIPFVKETNYVHISRLCMPIMQNISSYVHNYSRA